MRGTALTRSWCIAPPIRLRGTGPAEPVPLIVFTHPPPGAWGSAVAWGQRRPKARVTVWVTPSPWRCSAVTRKDT